MQCQSGLGADVPSENSSRPVKLDEDEEDEEEYRSCCGDEEDWSKETDNSVNNSSEDDLEEVSVRILFKGVSMADAGESGLSGIGVVIERSANHPDIQVQKKLDFYVEDSVANYLALMDGLAESLRNKNRQVFAFTDSEILYNQISHQKGLDNPLLMALKERIMDHVHNLETFILKLVPTDDLERPSKLAQVAIGMVSLPSKGDLLVESCSICFEEKPSPMMIKMKCSHKFCTHCMRTYVDGKLQSSEVPIRCPQPRCRYNISTSECRSFLPVACYESLERALVKNDAVNSEKLYCPFPDCSVLLDPNECLSMRASSSNHMGNRCVECPVCLRFVCSECGVPWHSSMSCEEFQNLPLEEERSERSYRWSRCQTCLAGRLGCECMFWGRRDLGACSQEFEQWAWDTFDPIPATGMDAYSEQERSQLALIQRFLAGGFGLGELHHPCQSPPRRADSHADAVKELRRLPWLEGFVSVISGDYCWEDYIQ